MGGGGDVQGVEERTAPGPDASHAEARASDSCVAGCCQCWPICSCCGCTGASGSRSKGPRSTHGSNALARRSGTSIGSEPSANGGGNSSRRGRQPSRNTATCHFSVSSKEEWRLSDDGKTLTVSRYHTGENKPTLRSKTLTVSRYHTGENKPTL